ncbi:hypothetical protein REJC140_00107 [Pseudorhizobium endolithicum]|uniref:Uncharacterized protein n=1 Tax=Pseudorhizobium endolithicum TaxID=1191678 RepID=A0ABM8PCI4_9HYPH|nr:hypothetical protein [Pseudorhizobium endolithicum]CAD7023142.1 hypothetical protein REJC140_00107 [Pseudorhizobium endolithicum]
MTKRFIISGSQELTTAGKIGAALFVFSPIASGAFYYWFLRELTRQYSGSPEVPLMMMGLCGITFLAGIVLVIVGRSYSYSAREAEETGAKGLWS